MGKLQKFLLTIRPTEIIVDTDFAQEQIDEGRDFCYFLLQILHFQDYLDSLQDFGVRLF